jgi:hypothetical protein
MNRRDTIRNYNDKKKTTLKSLLPHRCCKELCVQHWNLEDSKKNTFEYLPGVSEKCKMCESRLQYCYEGKWRQHSSYKIVEGEVRLAQRKKENPKTIIPSVKNHLGVKRKRESSIGSYENYSNVSNVPMEVNSKQIGKTDIMDNVEYLQYLKNYEDIPEPKLQKTIAPVNTIEENLSWYTTENLVETFDQMLTFEDYPVFLKIH